MDSHNNYQNIQSKDNFSKEAKNSKNDFSFQRNISKTQDSIHSKNRYESIKAQLMSVQNNILIDIAIGWLKQNDNLKFEMHKRSGEKIRYEQQNKSLKQSLKQKRQEIQLLTSNQQKNRHIIQKLELRIKMTNSKNNRQNNQIHKDASWENKYKNLAKYMDEYINQTTQVQQQFQRNFTIMKNQNDRLLECKSEQNKLINELEFKNKILCQKLQITIRGFQQFRNMKFSNQKQISDLKNIHQEIKTSINKVNNKKPTNCYQASKDVVCLDQSPIKQQHEKPKQCEKQVNSQQISDLKRTIINLQSEIIYLKQQLKETEEQIQDLETNNNTIRKQVQQLVKQNLQIRKHQNDQTQKFIKQIQIYQQQINNAKQNTINIQKNSKHNIAQFASQDKQNIKGVFSRSLSLKSINKPAVYVPPLNIKATINNQQISYKLMDKMI